MTKKWVSSLFLLLIIAAWVPGPGFSQSVPDHYANNAVSIEWKQIQTAHFQIVFPGSQASILDEIAVKAEEIYREYKVKMGVAPPQIALYFQDDNELVSGLHARDTQIEYSIWTGNVLAPDQISTNDLRLEIAYAFTKYAERPTIDYINYLFAWPSETLWSQGWISWLANPDKTSYELRFLEKYRKNTRKMENVESFNDRWFAQKLGRSQIHYFNDSKDADSLQAIYSNRKSLIGLTSYFYFKDGFKNAAGITFDDFEEQWRSDIREMKINEPSVTYDTVSSSTVSDFSTTDIKPYNALLNNNWDVPVLLPYYLSRDDFGLGVYLNFKEPLRTHNFNFYGILSMADPVYKSYFFSKYVNNSFRPRIELYFNHLSAGSEWLGSSPKMKSTNVLALTSLWKLAGMSEDHNNWFAGFALRHFALDYFPESTLRSNHPNVFFSNKKTQQIDLKLMIAWRSLEPNRNNVIHPPDGAGVRFLLSGSEKIPGSQVRYARLNLEGYTILPALNNHRLYLYGNGVLDIGEPAGEDYLSFTKNRDYQLPEPNFWNSINPGVDRLVRGYTKPLLGDRYAFGRMEYRIPLQFNTTKKLFGFIPPARTSFAFFADGGVMGDARLSPTRKKTKYRYSIGAEVKRVFSIGDKIELIYELGIGQPLTRSFAPHPYFNVKMPIPF